MSATNYDTIKNLRKDHGTNKAPATKNKTNRKKKEKQKGKKEKNQEA